MDSTEWVPRPPLSLSDLSRSELESLLVDLLSEVAGLKQLVAEHRDEIARLKGEQPRPAFKPSGMEKGTDLPKPLAGKTPRRCGKVQPMVAVEDSIVLVSDALPAGSVFKGFKDYVVQDLIVSVRATRYRRACWRTPGGTMIVAPLPAGICGHFGPELRRFVLMQYHQGQSTLPRLTVQLRAIGVSVSKRQVQRLLTEGQEAFLSEDKDVLRAGLACARWVSVDDTGARHRASNGVCTQIGNDRFTAFRTTQTKSRLNCLGLLRGEHSDFVLNDTAFAFMRTHGLSQILCGRLIEHPARYFAGAAVWQAHLNQLGFGAQNLALDRSQIATEGAVWGSIHRHGILRDGVILSDGARQFGVGSALHCQSPVQARCWVHAERMVHQLDTFTDPHRQAQTQVRTQIWRFYAALKAYRRNPSPHRCSALRAWFDRIFLRKTGFVTLDRLLRRLHASKEELLMVLQRPEIPLHTNGSENDIRCQVTRRKVSAGTRSDPGRDCRDTFLGLARTCMKQGITFWDYLGARLKVPGHRMIPPLDQCIRSQPHTA